MTTASAGLAWRYFAERDALLAEAHVRPYTPLAAPMLATRIATLSGDDAEDADRERMVALCRRFGQPEPGPRSRSCLLDAGGWRMRWERHTEVSTWTFYRPPSAGAAPFTETALDLAPRDWLASLPGEVLAAARLEALSPGNGVSATLPFGDEAVGSTLSDGAFQVGTDFRPDSLGMTRFLLLDDGGDPSLSGRTVQAILEIETYRLMALLAFPVAGASSRALVGLEAKASELAARLPDASTPDSDRELLDRLAGLAGETEALIGRTGTRFAAAEAYHEIVRDRIGRLRETRLDGLQTIGEFMQRRLDPAMRTCQAAQERQLAAIDRLSRMTQLLETRVEVAAETTRTAVLKSMDRRAGLQLRLQQAVEGISTFAIAYYAVGLLIYPLNALARLGRGFDATLAAGLMAPVILIGVWWSLRQFRRRLTADADSPRDERVD